MIVMAFASLAPTVSHALVNLTGNKAFTQQVCTSNGAKVVIQVKTTMGKQLATELTLNSVNPSKPQTAQNHFEHCPFCANPHNTAYLPDPNNLIIQTLEAEAQTIAEHAVVAAAFQPYLTPPSQAPPQFSSN
ncbi:MAG TPA: DUF2946 domain-containing protein [Methylotenera sp.]|nr:DUF2946 domain-containing protein [Methylotenera sp.]